MNKKYLLVAFALILAVSFTNIARANSFNDILNTLSNQLHWLRDSLKAQVQLPQLQPAPSPYPIVSNIHSPQPVTVRPILENYMKTCQKDSDCAIVNIDCCSCFNGGSNESLRAINRSYFEGFARGMSSFCGYFGMQCSGKDQCTKDARLNSITCRNNQCYAEFHGNFVVATNFLPKSTTNITKYLCDPVKKTCTVVNSAQHPWSSHLYNTLAECQTACSRTTTTTSTSTSTTTSTTTAPQVATDQWYKLTGYEGCKMDEWTKTCIDTIAATNSGDPYKFCMNQYLLSKKISFTDLTVKNIPEGTIICLACGCEMPEIHIKAKTNFESQLKDIGFSRSSDPSEKPEEQAKDNKLSIDLSYQGLFYKEDRDTSKINYAILSKNDKVTCGDNICHPRENYLYQIDLSKHCSVLADKIINFDHCPQDCKDTFDTTKAITKDEFNKLEFGCKNQPQPEPTVITPKPPEQMTQAEKNNLIMQLQQQLLTLLVYLRDLLLAQR